VPRNSRDNRNEKGFKNFYIDTYNPFKFETMRANKRFIGTTFQQKKKKKKKKEFCRYSENTMSDPAII